MFRHGEDKGMCSLPGMQKHCLTAWGFTVEAHMAYTGAVRGTCQCIHSIMLASSKHAMAHGTLCKLDRSLHGAERYILGRRWLHLCEVVWVAHQHSKSGAAGRLYTLCRTAAVKHYHRAAVQGNVCSVLLAQAPAFLRVVRPLLSYTCAANQARSVVVVVVVAFVTT